MRSTFAFLTLIPAILVAQNPPADAQAQVAHYAALIKTYAKAVTDKAVRPPTADTPEGLSVRIAHETDPGRRQLMLMARFLMLDAKAKVLPKLPTEVANYVFTVQTSTELELSGQISPDSPALDLLAAIQPEFLGFVAWHASGGGFTNQSENAAATKAFAFYDEVFAKHPNRAVKLLALESAIELHSRPRQIPEVRATLARLEAFQPTSPSIPKWKEWLTKAEVADKSAPKAGNPVPTFAVEDLDHAGRKFTPASFKGKYWLLDFWATWCGPCKGELPFVHKAYAKYHAAGLEILSISRDRKTADITAFRKDPQHPMPWNHAFPQGKASDALMDMFQVRGIPHVLLVGPDGKILATEGLRGEELDRTLGTYLHVK